MNYERWVQSVSKLLDRIPMVNRLRADDDGASIDAAHVRGILLQKRIKGYWEFLFWSAGHVGWLSDENISWWELIACDVRIP